MIPTAQEIIQEIKDRREHCRDMLEVIGTEDAHGKACQQASIECAELLKWIYDPRVRADTKRWRQQVKR